MRGGGHRDAASFSRIDIPPRSNGPRYNRRHEIAADLHPAAAVRGGVDRAAAEDPDALLKGYSDLHPMGCVGSIDDVAQAALFLAGDESQFITGIALPVDGGMTI